ncbi:hypothetical protein HZC32_03320, partial [Candidatus Woesearchaeota archaeon]|nr:hypothetical protein [Candidatus Woesearchaeota archaeon]
ATVLDVSLLGYFSNIYVFFIVFAIVFALLQKTKVISDALGINAIVAVAASLLVLLSKTLVDIINFMVPWFAVVIIFLVLMILIFMTFGAGEKDIASAVKDKTLMWTLIGIGIVIIVAAFGNVLGQSLTEASFQSTTGPNTIGLTNATGGESGVATKSFQQNIYSTLFHPKVLGLIILFAVAIFAIAFLSGNLA